mgnify:CR=1 FL=1
MLCVGSCFHFHHLWICCSISFSLYLQVVLKDLCAKTNGYNSPVLSILYEHRRLDEDDYKELINFSKPINSSRDYITKEKDDYER